VAARHRLAEIEENFIQEVADIREGLTPEEGKRVVEAHLVNHRKKVAMVARELESARAKLWADHLEAARAQLEDDDDA
jgi:hypothetical protein